jgi:hypothetical protein
MPYVHESEDQSIDEDTQAAREPDEEPMDLSDFTYLSDTTISQVNSLESDYATEDTMEDAENEPPKKQ